MKKKQLSKLRFINPFRHAVQIFILLFLIGIPTLSLYQSYESSHAIEWMLGKEKIIFENIRAVVTTFLDNPKVQLDAVKGSVWSARVGPVSLSDPLAIVGQIAAEKSIYWPFALTVSIPLLLSILLGRIFCGWICPAYLFYEIGDKLRQLLNQAGIQPLNFTLPSFTKYGILGVGVLCSVILGFSIFPMIYPPAVISREFYDIVYYGMVGSGVGFVLLSLFLEITVSRRAVCRYLCPGGALYSLLGKFRLVRIARKESACIQCVKCDDTCGLGLQPMTDKTGMECNNCTACIAVCPTNALTLQFSYKDQT